MQRECFFKEKMEKFDMLYLNLKTTKMALYRRTALLTRILQSDSILLSRIV